MDIPALIGELTGDDPARRMAAADALVKAGAPAVEPLIIAGVTGWDALDASEQQLVRRLIRIQIRQESPEPMGVCGSWIAVPTTDQAAVREAFGLGEAEPVTMRLGLAAHSDTLTYVTPALNGWTLVFGGPHNETAWVDLVEPMKAWSRRFGAAHSYCTFEGITAWCIAEHGEIVRDYCNETPDEQIGPPHPAEHGGRLPHGEYDLERDMALQFDERMEKFVGIHFTGPHPADLTPESMLPAMFLWDWIDEFMDFFEVEGTGADWYPDETFADVDRFRRATVALATAALGPGEFERFRQEEATPEVYATNVAERASVNPRTLGPHVRVEGHAILARSAGDGGGSPFRDLCGEPAVRGLAGR